MERTKIRLVEVELKNFKNVKYGKIDLRSKNKEYDANILGVYGQNGSGKTALIDALEVLKILTTGESLKWQVAEYINVDSSQSEMSFEFEIERENHVCDLTYSFSIERALKKATSNALHDFTEPQSIFPKICNEKLKLKFMDLSNNESGKVLINTSVKSAPFGSRENYNSLIGNDSILKKELMNEKQLSSAESRSFLFSREVISRIRKNSSDISDPKVREAARMIDLFASLANYNFFVVNTSFSGMISLNMLIPVSFNVDNGQSRVNGVMPLPLNENSEIPVQFLEAIRIIIPNLNTVLKQIVPGLTITLHTGSPYLSEKSQEVCKVEFFSNKNSKEIPLRYESEGIKKIISVLSLLINVFNHSNFIMAVDELDAGIFEYLLGELLELIQDRGKGQLIFTSHDLRPLEVLDKSFLLFTTTNPENRYIRLENIKPSNNVRSFYFRDILVGLQKENVYEHTSKAKIGAALRKACQNV